MLYLDLILLSITLWNFYFSLVANAVPVPSLNRVDFEQFIISEPLALVLFYAPWCSISKSFLPIFESLTTQDFSLGKVNCVEEEYLYESQKIQSFPTVRAFIYGTPIEYQESFDADGINTFIKRLAESGAKSLEVEGGMAKFVSKRLGPTKPIAVAFSSDPNMLINFDLVCMKTSLVTCAVSESLATATELNVPFPSIFIQRQFVDEEPIVFAPQETLLDTEQLTTWFYNYSYPQIIAFSPDNEDLIFSTNRPGYSTHIVIVGDSRLDAVQELLGIFRRLFNGYRNRCVFISIDTSNPSEYISNILTDIQLARSTPTTLLAIKTMQTKVEFVTYEKQPAEAEMERIAAWIDEILLGRASVTRTVMTS